MMYEFSITDTYNYKKERIMEDALIAAQEEFDFLGIKERPSVEPTSGRHRLYTPSSILVPFGPPVYSNSRRDEILNPC